VRRTNPRLGLVIGDRLALNQLQPWLVRIGDVTPRYLVHGIVAAVGIIAVTSIAIQPRPTPIVATQPAAAVEQSTPLVALEAVTSDAAALESGETATTTEEPLVEEAPRKPPLQPIKHIVEEGDSIRMLAARYSVSPVTILAANNLNDPDMLQIGQELIILPTDGVLYTLRPGESIRRVAEGFGVPIEEVISANELGSSPDVVQPGTQLVVPGATPAWPRNRATAEPGEPELVAASIGGGERLPIEGASRVIPSTRTYEVQAGDTLNGIADAFGVDVATVLSSNGISNPNAIKPGVELRILPVKGVEYTVGADETLAEIAWKYQVDLGVLLDYNDLNDPDVINVGNKLVIPGGQRRPEAAPAPAVEVTVPRAQPRAPAPAVVRPAPAAPAASKPAAKPAAPAPAPAAPQTSVGRGGGNIVANAMKFVGHRYRFGGTSPAGFDCSGFVYYVHNVSGSPVGRGMWQQYNGGARIPISSLQPGDTVFFANTYMPGLSHDGIYIGGGQFVHASDERTGVTISSMNSGYWQSKYVGATRLWN
jgi:cell wall-associated NlpC family hydrolase